MFSESVRVVRQGLGGGVGSLMVSRFGLLHILSWRLSRLTTRLGRPLVAMSDPVRPLPAHLFQRFETCLLHVIPLPVDVRMSGTPLTEVSLGESV